MTVAAGRGTPLWAWWTLLSLDAPSVAVSWQVLFGKSLGVRVPFVTSLALFTTVWLIYVADRLLDVRNVQAGCASSARHRFYQVHGHAIRPFVFGAVVLLAVLAPRLTPAVLTVVLPLTLIVGLYFAAVHWLPSRVKRYWPKEVVVGLVFALGTALPVRAQAGHSEWRFGSALLLFAALCSCNCVAIEYWEWCRQHGALPDVAALWLGSRLTRMAAAIIVAGVSLWLWQPGADPMRLLDAAVVTSAGVLLLLDSLRDSASLDVLRTLADAALLSPVVLLFLQRVA